MRAQQSHREGRIIHDADSHIIEYPGWLESYSSEYVKANLKPSRLTTDNPLFKRIIDQADNRLAGNDPELTKTLKANIFGAKEKLNMWAAFGATKKEERSESLDIMGISSQLVFPSIAMARFSRTDMDVMYGGADALKALAITGAIPFVLVMLVHCYCLIKSLREEVQKPKGL